MVKADAGSNDGAELIYMGKTALGMMSRKFSCKTRRIRQLVLMVFPPKELKPPNKVCGVYVAGINPSFPLGCGRDVDQGCMEVGVDCRELKVPYKENQRIMIFKTHDSSVKRSCSLSVELLMNAPVTSPHSGAGFPQRASPSLVSNFSFAGS